MSRRIVRLATLVCLLALVLPVAQVWADDGDPLEGLTEAEKAYVTSLKAAYSDARASLGIVEGKLGSAALGAFLGVEASPTEVVSAVASCAGELDGIAPRFLESPPASMEGIAGANEAVAATLSSAFDSCVVLTVNEGIQQALNAGRDFLSGLLGAPSEPPPEEQTSLKARVVACVTGEIDHIEGVLDAGEAALDAAVADIKASQQMGEDFLEAFFSGECFIATAAYGTRSAVQIDVLRDFRDEVLMMSAAGRDFVGFYYAASPPLADFIARHEALRTVVREGLVDPVVWAVERLEPLWQG
jgi:hypothetical protein